MMKGRNRPRISPAPSEKLGGNTEVLQDVDTEQPHAPLANELLPLPLRHQSGSLDQHPMVPADGVSPFMSASRKWSDGEDERMRLRVLRRESLCPEDGGKGSVRILNEVGEAQSDGQEGTWRQRNFTRIKGGSMTFHQRSGEDGDTFLFRQNQNLWHIVDHAYTQSTKRPGGELDRRLKTVKKAVKDVSLSSVMFTSTPFASLLTKRPFQIILVMLVLYHGVQSAISWKNLSEASNRKFRGTTFRATPLQTRGGWSSWGDSPPQDFGVVDNGCPVLRARSIDFEVVVARGAMEMDGAATSTVEAAIITYEKEVEGQGWYFVTNEALGTEESDPVRYQFHVLAGGGGADGEEWLQIGSSHWLWGDFTSWFTDWHNTAIPLERGATVVMDTRIPWDVYLNGPVLLTTDFVVFGLVLLLAWQDTVNLAKWPYIAGVVVKCVIIIAVAKGRSDRHELWLMLESVGEMLVMAWFGLGLVLWERRMNASLMATSALMMIFKYLPFFGTGGEHFLSAETHIKAVSNLAILLLGLLMWFWRKKSLRHSLRAILPDKLRYDELWDRMLQEEETRKDLKDLGQFMHCWMDHVEARHYMHPQDHEEETNADHNLFMNQPVASLDQLYAQAVSLDVILRDKVCAWALASNGSFQCGNDENSRPQYKRWSDIRDDDGLLKAVKWATVKNSDRAIQKAVRTYNNDVSRLVDIVRNSIVYDTVSDLIQGLQVIVTDPDIAVERIKNRLDFEYNSWDSAGYRDVSINVRVNSAETQRLGVDLHVCEVQLILKRFGEMKVDEGHRRYVVYRDSRGE